MCNSSRPHGLQPTRLLHPWDYPGKSTGVGCHFLLQRFPLAGYFTQGSVYMSIPISQSHPLLPHCVCIPVLNICIIQEGVKKKRQWLWHRMKLGGIFEVKSLSCVRLFATAWTVAYKAPPSMGLSRQEYWSGLLFTSPEDLPNPGIESGSPTLSADALPSEPLRKSIHI